VVWNCRAALHWAIEHNEADMADFMLRQLQDAKYLRKVPAVSN